MIHDNVEVATTPVEPKDAACIELQGLLLRAVVEDFAFKRSGANRFQRLCMQQISNPYIERKSSGMLPTLQTPLTSKDRSQWKHLWN